MTITLFWAFAITVFLTGSGASCGVSDAPEEFKDFATCETARAAYEAAMLVYQTPTRRVSTLECTQRVRSTP